MPKNIILKNKKISFTRKVFKSEKLRKWPKKGKKWPFFGHGGPNFDPFFTIFCKSLLNMPKNIILKNKKISLSRKIFKAKKLQKRSKKGQKWPFFGPPGPNFAKIKKGLDILLLFSQRGCVPNFRKFGSSDLEKMRYGRTDERKNGRTGLKS